MTPADNKKPVSQMAQQLTGKLFGDRGMSTLRSLNPFSKKNYTWSPLFVKIWKMSCCLLLINYYYSN